MANNRNRYKQFEFKMTLMILANAVLFFLFLLFSGMGITWLKITLAIVCGLEAVVLLGILYLNQEIGRPRSIWMTISAVSIIVCMTVSLILNYPA